MKTEDIYTTYQSRKGGSSGTGNSFYTSAATCGRRARIEAEDAAVPREFVPATEPAPFGTGTAYHLFHEIAATAQLPEDLILDMTDKAVDANFLEGLRLFRGWQSLWGSVQAKYGEVIAAEVEVGGGEYTGRLDLVVDIQDTQGVYQRTGLYVEPGIYIIDWKTAKGPHPTDAIKFTQGTQAGGYLQLYPQAKGVIFDGIYKHKSFTHTDRMASTGKLLQGKSYFHYLQVPQHDDKQVTEGLVKLGKYMYENNIANRSQCEKPYFQHQLCPHFLSGRCSGY